MRTTGALDARHRWDANCNVNRRQQTIVILTRIRRRRKQTKEEERSAREKSKMGINIDEEAYKQKSTYSYIASCLCQNSQLMLSHPTFIVVWLVSPRRPLPPFAGVYFLPRFHTFHITYVGTCTVYVLEYRHTSTMTFHDKICQINQHRAAQPRRRWHRAFPIVFTAFAVRTQIAANTPWWRLRREKKKQLLSI